MRIEILLVLLSTIFLGSMMIVPERIPEHIGLIFAMMCCASVMIIFKAVKKRIRNGDAKQVVELTSMIALFLILSTAIPEVSEKMIPVLAVISFLTVFTISRIIWIRIMAKKGCEDNQAGGGK